MSIPEVFLAALQIMLAAMALCEMSSALDEQSIGVSVLYVWPIRVLIENQWTASPKLVSAMHRDNSYQSYSFSSEQQF